MKKKKNIIKRFINRMITLGAYHWFIGKGNKRIENHWKASNFCLKYKIK